MWTQTWVAMDGDIDLGSHGDIHILSVIYMRTYTWVAKTHRQMFSQANINAIKLWLT